jgi:hypothetical protein
MHPSAERLEEHSRLVNLPPGTGVAGPDNVQIGLGLRKAAEMHAGLRPLEMQATRPVRVSG